MALGGGIFQDYNKILPGAYINVVTTSNALKFANSRGIVALQIELSWGDTLMDLSKEDFELNTVEKLGYNYTDDEMKNLREVFRGARLVKLYRLNHEGKKAKATIGTLEVEAVYNGIKGNDIKVVIQKNIDEDGKFEVKTLFNNRERDIQIVLNADELIGNNFVNFKGKGLLEVTAATPLTGGENGVSTGEHFSDFLKAMERESFTTIVYPGEDELTKQLLVNFVRRLRDEDGYKVNGVIYNMKSDYQGIINVKNSPELTYWVAGKSAGANINESLTNKLYDGEYKVDTKYTKSEFEEFILTGQFVFYEDKGTVRVLKDINSFTSFTHEQGEDLSSNRTMRTLDHLANRIAVIFNDYYLSNDVDNDDTGRDLFKKDISSECESMERMRAIQNHELDDITVEQGTTKRDVKAEARVQTVDSMEKLYMTVFVV